MSFVKVNDQFGETKYYIQLERINYVEYVKSTTLFGEGHFEVVFSGEGQPRLALTEEQGKAIISALEGSIGSNE